MEYQVKRYYKCLTEFGLAPDEVDRQDEEKMDWMLIWHHQVMWQKWANDHEVGDAEPQPLPMVVPSLKDLLKGR